MKNKNFVVDTSFISSMLFYDVNTTFTENLAAKLQDSDKVFIPVIVLLELTSLKHKKSFEVIYNDIKRLKNILGAEIIYFDDGFFDSFLEFRKNNDLQLKANDASILFSAIYKKAELITFDKKLSKVYKSLQK